MMRIAIPVLVAGALFAVPADAQHAVFNWESPHIHPLDVTPDGARLLAVNTADNRLEVYNITTTAIRWVASVPVGLDPVSVRVRNNDEAWVVNHISDSISVVDLNAMQVTASLPTGDEPTDVVFAGVIERAFVCTSQENAIEVYSLDPLSSSPTIVPIEGEDPRALATDGTHVFAAIFESGNNTTILAQTDVSNAALNPYPGDPNPPPNDGAAFNPPINPDLGVTPPEVSLIVKKSGAAWLDDNGGDWSAAVTWDLHDHDLAIIDANSPGLSTSYVDGMMNLNMAMGVGPSGEVLVVGTEADNHIRFEPNVNGTFVRVMGARLSGAGDTTPAIVDLNPHLDYLSPTVDQGMRDQSIGDPRGVAFHPSNGRAYITGMGSNNLIEVDAALGRVARLDVGEGPTGIVYRQHVDGDRLFVLNRFEGSVSVIDPTTLTEIAIAPFFDPTPAVIRNGRPHLYDTHETSGLGHVSCASCHIDGRMDNVAWDLGDPSGAMKEFNQVCNGGIGGCEDWHPMKGPMTTQTLVGIIGTGPLHWRGDREDLAAFNGAFESLLGDDEQLTGSEMIEFENFVATMLPPPNPFRNRDGSLPNALFNGGNPQTGETLFLTSNLDGVDCVTCHAMPTGTNGQLTSASLLQETQSIKIPQLRNMYEKTGFFADSSDNNRGFGFIHDGSIDTLFEFLKFPGFSFANGDAGDQQRRDVEAFLFTFGEQVHAGVGVQVTLGGVLPGSAVDRDALLAIADSQPVSMIVKGVYDNEQRGLYYTGSGQFQSDRSGEVLSTAQLDAEVTAGGVLTFTLVPAGAEVRMGVDRDSDGHFDRDELNVCADPADPSSFPGSNSCPSDITGAGGTGDGNVNVEDLLFLLSEWGNSESDADANCDGIVNVNDLLQLLADWGVCPP